MNRNSVFNNVNISGYFASFPETNSLGKGVACCFPVGRFIRISSILIPKSFIDSPPSQKKINRAVTYLKDHGEIDKPIVVKSFRSKKLMDNITRLIAAYELDYKVVAVLTEDEYKCSDFADRKYIMATFHEGGKPYYWQFDTKLKLKVGDKVLVESSHGKLNKNIVTVKEIFESDDPAMKEHKYVVKKIHSKKE